MRLQWQLKKGNNLTYSLIIINEDFDSIVNFTASSGTLAENSTEGITIQITFSHSVQRKGEILISLLSDYDGFTTVPSMASNKTIVLPVGVGQTSASIKVFPVDNMICSDYDNNIEFTIAFTSGSLKKGNNLNYKLNLVDDDVSSIVSFVESSGSIEENNGDGKLIKLILTDPAHQNDQIYLKASFDSSNYQRFITDPPFDDEANGCIILLDVLKGDVSKEAKVYPVDNNEKGDLIVYFKVGGSGCVKPHPDNTYTLTIIDDE